MNLILSGAVAYAPIRSHPFFTCFADIEDWSRLVRRAIRVSYVTDDIVVLQPVSQPVFASSLSKPTLPVLTRQPSNIKDKVTLKDLETFARITNAYQNLLEPGEKVLYSGQKMCDWLMSRGLGLVFSAGVTHSCLRLV